MPTVDSNSTSKAGIATTADGQRHIPSSVRADGSVRKEIKVRPGYRPPEDVEVYKNRTAEAWKNRGSSGVPGAESSEAEKPSQASNKNAKRREARKKAAAAQGDGTGTADKLKAATEEFEEMLSKDLEAKATIKETVDPEAEKEKEAKKLLKKLRQARELKEKKDKGDALLPEQFEKVIRINELIRQLDQLGYDADGTKKADGSSAIAS